MAVYREYGTGRLKKGEKKTETGTAEAVDLGCVYTTLGKKGLAKPKKPPRLKLITKTLLIA